MCQLTCKLLTSLYHREAQYILLKRVASQEASRPGPREGSETETTCLLVESVEALQEVAREIPTTMRDSVDQLKQRVAQGCIVTLARRPQKAAAGQQVIGYGIYERGVFSALGRQGTVSSDLLFNHYIEVLPEYRGQRIADVMRRAIDVYCRAQRLTKRCTVVSPSNESSLRSDLRFGYTIVGTVARVSLLQGLFVWETSWESIAAALRQEEPRGDQ
jgi:L-amino acid N-acyltransferase YncA